MKLPEINEEELIGFLTGLLNTPSPTGFTHKAIEYTQTALEALEGISLEITPKGALLATLEGQNPGNGRALSAHIDTLGAMVKEIKSNGRLRLTRIGGYPWNSVEAEGCTIFPRNAKPLRGTIMPAKASVHVYGKNVSETKRDDENMEVRIDAHTTSKGETQALGVEVGDFVALDARVEINNGFIRSRHLDDKAGAACLVAALKALVKTQLKPIYKTCILFSNYEEVGHGATSGIPSDTSELVVVDMAAVGAGQNSDEFHTTICIKDSGGPYHHGLSQKLREIAETHQIAYRTDVYPYYQSDGSAYWRSGGGIPVALIGPGVDASHHYERTHIDSLEATTQWIMAYILSE